MRLQSSSHSSRGHNHRVSAPAARVFAGLACLLTLQLSSFTSLGNWPGWRGPGQNHSAPAAKLPTQWTAEAAAWKAVLPGKGGSTPIVWGDRIYLTTPADGEDAVMALDFSGQQEWLTKLGPASNPKHRTLGSSCNSSPVTDGKGVFAYFRSGHFVALELDGTVRWRQNLTEKHGAERLFWDQGSSPVLTDQHVILARLHQGESWVAGFDKATGELKWQVARNYQVPTENDNGYATPVFFEQDGKLAFLLWASDHLTAHSADNGELLWTVGGFNPDATGFWPAISSPVVVGDLAIVPVGRDDRRGQSRIHAIKLGGKGDVTKTHRAWERNDVGVFVPALAVHAGRVYLLRNRGEIVCLNPTTGETVWTGSLPEGRSSYYASPLIANGVLYAAREDGAVFAARVGENFELLGESAMGERIIASPVPAGNLLLLRGDQHLFGIAAK